jgi:hypothetical protein
MTRLFNLFRVPASESSTGIVLAICTVALSLMSIALVWQARVIADQRETIRFLSQLKFGG